MSSDDDIIWTKERECLLLLLEARVLLRNIVDIHSKKLEEELDKRNKKRELERRLRGDLTPFEIGDILKREGGGDDIDYNSELAKLKRLVIQEIKRGHVLEGQLAQIDIKIALVIDNKGATMSMAAKRRENFLARLQSRRKQPGEETKRTELTQQQMDCYGELFYLLQTEPKYLAKCLFLLQPSQVEGFLERVVLTLFGEAFSPREEFLILQLFAAASEQEISVVKNVSDFLSPDSVVPKLLVAYNRRMLGMVYLKSTLVPLIEIVQQNRDVDFELNPVMVAAGLGKQVANEDEALRIPEVSTAVDQRVAALQKLCANFLDAFIGSLDKLPYGLRWICKMMRELCEKKLPDSSKDDVLRLTGYFVYYRFINVALISPEKYNLVTKELGMKERKNLLTVSKVLQKAFNLKPFNKAEKAMMPLNPFLEQYNGQIVKYFNTVVHVADPEDHLEVDQYMELTRKEKPNIQIDLNQVFLIHSLVYDKQENLCGRDDLMRALLKDLGKPPETDATDTRAVTLTLQPRSKQEIKEEEANNQLYGETKELMIPILRAIPSPQTVHEMTLIDTLQYGRDWARQQNQKGILDMIDTVLKNLEVLEKAGMVNSKDDHKTFVHDLAVEVSNRASIRERQKKEVARLRVVLDKLKQQTKFVEEQVVDYNKVFQAGLQNMKSGGKKEKNSPVKFSYKKLSKEHGVIIDSEVPENARKKYKFIFTASIETPGLISVEVHDGKNKTDDIDLRLDDLLDKHYWNVSNFAQAGFTFDTDMTLFVVNKFVMAR